MSGCRGDREPVTTTTVAWGMTIEELYSSCILNCLTISVLLPNRHGPMVTSKVLNKPKPKLLIACGYGKCSI